ncbi:MAG: hypothetical protein Q6L68_00925 [Thermostichus sp. DG02_5_bins_236]
MPYDNLCKALVERNPLPFVHWLVGQTPEPIQILKTELSVEPIRADFVSFLQVGSRILHLEFQTDPDPNIPLRMLDYYVRLRRPERCARLAFGGVDEFDLIDEVAEVVKEVDLQMLNTRERGIADLTVSDKFSGQIVGAEEYTCSDPVR